jgi:hypothetical protein
MPIQRIRHDNLDRVLRWLKDHQVVGWDAQTRYLGSPVTARRLEIMASGGDIPVLVARHIEFVLGLPRNWIDDPDAAPACLMTRRLFTHTVQGDIDADSDCELQAGTG